VLPSPARSGDFLNASMVLEFDLKPRGAKVNQALDLGEAHGLKSQEIGPKPLPSVLEKPWEAPQA
jgi:hypothetical protein